MAGYFITVYLGQSADFFQDDHPHFLEYAAELANVLRNIIFVDQNKSTGYCIDCLSVGSSTN